MPDMKPIAYVDRLNEFYRAQGFPPYQWTVNHAAPLTPMRKTLGECTVAMLTSGGVSRCDAAPFNPMARNDLRLDDVPADTPASFFQIHDSYYNHVDADRDINCIFPIDRLRELAAEGAVGAVAPHHYSGFMGRIYTRSAVINQAAPALASKLRDERVDAFLLVPA
jgi:D-proline reductase (dithiol) PrdB